MKRIFCAVLVFCIAMLSGCGKSDSNSVSFFYCRSPENYQYFEEEGVISSESRDITGHRSDIRYVLGLYLAGPLEEGLVAPFSAGTRLISAQRDGQTIVIQLSDHNQSMTESSFSLACACLTLTCIHAFSCNCVTITSGERTISMDEDSLLLFDTLLPQEANGG